MTSEEEYQATCREAVYEWLITAMREWVGTHSDDQSAGVYDIPDWLAMLESEAPDMYILMLKRAEKFIPSVERGVVVDGI